MVLCNRAPRSTLLPRLSSSRRHGLLSLLQERPTRDYIRSPPFLAFLRDSRFRSGRRCDLEVGLLFTLMFAFLPRDTDRFGRCLRCRDSRYDDLLSIILSDSPNMKEYQDRYDKASRWPSLQVPRKHHLQGSNMCSLKFPYHMSC